MPKQLTQAEIVAVLRNYEASMVATLELRRRLEVEEAAVEPGLLATAKLRVRRAQGVSETGI